MVVATIFSSPSTIFYPGSSLTESPTRAPLVWGRSPKEATRIPEEFLISEAIFLDETSASVQNAGGTDRRTRSRGSLQPRVGLGLGLGLQRCGAMPDRSDEVDDVGASAAASDQRFGTSSRLQGVPLVEVWENFGKHTRKGRRRGRRCLRDQLDLRPVRLRASGSSGSSGSAGWG